MPSMEPPALTLDPHPHPTIRARGVWRVRALAQPKSITHLMQVLDPVRGRQVHWDLRQITALDHIGARFFWNAWGGKRPEHLALEQQHEEVFLRLEQAGELALPPQPGRHWLSIEAWR